MRTRTTPNTITRDQLDFFRTHNLAGLAEGLPRDAARSLIAFLTPRDKYDERRAQQLQALTEEFAEQSVLVTKGQYEGAVGTVKYFRWRGEGGFVIRHSYHVVSASKFGAGLTTAWQGESVNRIDSLNFSAVICLQINGQKKLVPLDLTMFCKVKTAS